MNLNFPYEQRVHPGNRERVSSVEVFGRLRFSSSEPGKLLRCNAPSPGSANAARLQALSYAGYVRQKRQSYIDSKASWVSQQLQRRTAQKLTF